MGFKLHYNYIIETHTIPSTTLLHERRRKGRKLDFFQGGLEPQLQPGRKESMDHSC